MRLIKILLLVGLLLGAGIGLLRDASTQLRLPLQVGTGQVFVIPAGASLQSVLESMQASGLTRSDRTLPYLRLYARFTQVNTQIKAGEYRIEPGMSILDALQLFVAGRTLLHPLRITEGTTLREVMEVIRGSDALKQTLAPDELASLPQRLGLDTDWAEGRLFPDTYHFARGTADVAFLRRAAAAMDAVLDEEWRQRAPGLPYQNPLEALVMASIIEKETGVAEERAVIAGVFVNRLRLGMRLQTDPTVIYGLGTRFDGNLRRQDLLEDTPYNTYTRAGLPPTPICMPGRASIHAALQPAQTKALFFVSRGDGSHEFSETLEQHNAAVARYQLRRTVRKQGQ
jgi:UPF0755 protein